MRKVMGGWKRLLFAAGALVVGATSLVAGAGTDADAATERHAIAGGGEAGIAVNVFSPASIAVTVGDTVTWTNPYTEPHSVAFEAEGGEVVEDFEAPLNAEAAEAFDGTETFSSGLFASEGQFAAAGDTFSVTFTETGSYTFFCTIHPGMVVDVAVVNGYVPPISEAGIENRIETGIDLGLAAADAIDVPGPTTGPDGKKVWTIPTPPAVPYEGSVVDVLRFTPTEVNIGVGDSVTWLNDSFTPHTVTFLNGPPPAGFSPFVPDVSSTTYEPGTFLNSGIIGKEELADFGVVGDSFSLKFNTPGTYQYLCALHADSGMVGIINVGGTSGGGGGGITPPSTGDAGLMDRSSGSWMMLAGVAVLLSSLGLATFATVRKDA